MALGFGGCLCVPYMCSRLSHWDDKTHGGNVLLLVTSISLTLDLLESLHAYIGTNSFHLPDQ